MLFSLCTVLATWERASAGVNLELFHWLLWDFDGLWFPPISGLCKSQFLGGLWLRRYWEARTLRLCDPFMHRGLWKRSPGLSHEISHLVEAGVCHVGTLRNPCAILGWIYRCCESATPFGGLLIYSAEDLAPHWVCLCPGSLELGERSLIAGEFVEEKSFLCMVT